MHELLDLLLPQEPFWWPALLVAAIHLARYLLLGGLAYGIWYKLGPKNSTLKIQSKVPGRKQIGKEILYSLIAIAIFGLVSGCLVGYGWFPHIQIYYQIADYGWAYFGVSIALMLIVHDTYFYWAHRLMHQRAVFRYIHRLHHRSTNPTPWTAYSFHPMEAVIEAGAVVLVIFLVPFHPLALFLFQTGSILYNVYGHLGYELYPQGWQRHWLGRWLNTSVAHNTHHARGQYNYGLYFLFWDRACGTLDPAYEQRYDEVKASKEQAVSATMLV